MNEIISNYAVVRFMPYRRTAEFINVGIIVCCPQLGYFDFKCADDHWRRVHGFFPELKREIFTKCLKSTKNELEELKRDLNTGVNTAGSALEAVSATWKELIKIREGIIHVTMPGLDRSEGPEQSLADLYNDFVARHFAQSREYQETVMQRRLATHLKRWHVRHLYHERRVGTDLFHVNLPFVHMSGDNLLSAIKPLDLDREDSTDIYQHGDRWVSNIRRLSHIEQLPQMMFFPVSMPAEPSLLKAAQDIVDELRLLKAKPVLFDQIDSIRNQISEAA